MLKRIEERSYAQGSRSKTQWLDRLYAQIDRLEQHGDSIGAEIQWDTLAISHKTEHIEEMSLLDSNLVEHDVLAISVVGVIQ